MVVKSQKQTEQFDIKEIYTPLSVAKKEIWRRWNDPVLKKKVEDFLGGELPKFLKKEPRAFLTRQIASPNREFFHFMEMSHLIGLKPLGWEFKDDLFVTTNREKAGLGKIGFFKKFNKKLDPIIFYKKIIDLTGKEENKKFKEIKTIWGEGFIHFHHKMLKLLFPKFQLYDASDWYKSKGKNSKEYYMYFLALFLRNGVLFENFNLNGHERKLSIKTVLPALKKIKEIFGINPLIVRLIPDEDVDSIEILCYSEILVKLLKNKTKK